MCICSIYIYIYTHIIHTQFSFRKVGLELGMVPHTCNSSTWETETRELEV